MERSLTSEPPEVRLPSALHLEGWHATRARAVHSLLRQAYRKGGGEVTRDFERWHRDFTGDVGFDPSAAFLAIDPQGALAGVALCWDSGFVKDLCVAELYRRRGLGAALLVHAMQYFAARGFSALRLKVESDNPSGALSLYRRLGFVCTGAE